MKLEARFGADYAPFEKLCTNFLAEMANEAEPGFARAWR
jgi:hypothetical protein